MSVRVQGNCSLQYVADANTYLVWPNTATVVATSARLTGKS